MNCPSCNSSGCRRSRRRGMEDYAYSVVGLIPWRCGQCGVRFRGRVLSMKQWMHAHCAICGNLELKRISPEHVPGTMGTIGRVLGLPAFRCEPCRHKFYSVRPLKKDTSQEEQPETEQKVA